MGAIYYRTFGFSAGERCASAGISSYAIQETRAKISLKRPTELQRAQLAKRCWQLQRERLLSVGSSCSLADEAGPEDVTNPILAKLVGLARIPSAGIRRFQKSLALEMEREWNFYSDPQLFAERVYNWRRGELEMARVAGLSADLTPPLLEDRGPSRRR